MDRKEKKIEEAKYLKRREDEQNERKILEDQIKPKSKGKRKIGENVFVRNYDEAVKRRLKQEQNEHFQKNLEKFHYDRKIKGQSPPTLQQVQNYGSERVKTEGQQIPEILEKFDKHINFEKQTLETEYFPEEVIHTGREDVKPFKDPALSKISLPEVKKDTPSEEIVDYQADSATLGSQESFKMNKTSNKKDESSSIINYDSYMEKSKVNNLTKKRIRTNNDEEEENDDVSTT